MRVVKLHLASLPLPSHFPFSFYKFTSPLIPTKAFCSFELVLQRRLELEDVSRPALAPKLRCFLSHSGSLQGWVGRADAAAQNPESLRPTNCHPSAWQGTTPRHQETKTRKINIFNAVITHDAVRLCCQENSILVSGSLLKSKVFKYFWSVCTLPFLGWEMSLAAFPHHLITSRCVPEMTLLSHTKKGRNLSEIQTWWSSIGRGP